MTHETSQLCEIGHFEASIPQMLTGSLRYIVSKAHKDAFSVLHADAGENTHLGVAKKAEVDPLLVLGGGFVAWGGSGLTLRGSSRRFGEEPTEFRLALITVLNERFHDDLKRYIESRTPKKEG